MNFVTSFSCPHTGAGRAVGGGPLFGSTDAGSGPSVMSCQVRSPSTIGPGAPTEVATKKARLDTGTSSSTKLPIPPSTVDGPPSSARPFRSGTLAMALLPGAP